MTDVAVAAAPEAPTGAATTPAAPESNGGWPGLTGLGLPKPNDVNPGAEGANPEAVKDDYWQPDEATAARKTKLKVDGKEIEMTVGDLHKNAQLGLASTQRMQEAARTKQEAAQAKREADDQTTMMASLIHSPADFFAEMVEADEESALQWVEALAKVAIARRDMTPDQRRLSTYERQEQQRAQEQQEARVQQAEQAMGKAWSKALQLAELQDDPMGHAVAAEMRERVEYARQNGRNETPQTLAAFAKQRMTQMREAWQRSLTADQRKALVTPGDVQQRAQESMRQPMVPTTAPAPRGSNGQFQKASRTQTYDPFM